MKKHLLFGPGVVLLCGLSFTAFAAPKDKTFKGEIMDSACAMNGSHADMLKKGGMGNKDPNDPMAKAMCAKGCAKAGGKFVLYDSASKKVYHLDDQAKPEQFAGQNVKVTGTLSKDTIHVTNIEPGS